MKDVSKESTLTTATLAGVFTGLIATLGNLAYDYFVRSITQFSPSQIINVATIIFMTMLFCVICGVLYYFVTGRSRRGQILYIVLFAVITVLCLYGSMNVTRSTDPKVTANFRILLSGLVGISGALVTFYIPYLMKHTSIFMDEVSLAG